MKDPRECKHLHEKPLPEIRRADGFVIQPWQCEECGSLRNETVEYVPPPSEEK